MKWQEARGGAGLAWQMATTLSSRVAFAAIDIEVAASVICFVFSVLTASSSSPPPPLLFVPLHLGSCHALSSCSMLQLGKCQKGVDTSSASGELGVAQKRAGGVASKYGAHNRHI